MQHACSTCSTYTCVTCCCCEWRQDGATVVAAHPGHAGHRSHHGQHRAVHTCSTRSTCPAAHLELLVVDLHKGPDVEGCREGRGTQRCGSILIFCTQQQHGGQCDGQAHTSYDASCSEKHQCTQTWAAATLHMQADAKLAHGLDCWECLAPACSNAVCPLTIHVVRVAVPSAITSAYCSRPAQVTPAVVAWWLTWRTPCIAHAIISIITAGWQSTIMAQHGVKPYHCSWATCLSL